VAFVGPTSLALSFFASGLKFRRNDNILIYFDDYPSNVYPWMALAEQGVEVRLMNTRGLGLIRPRDVMGQVDENTRLVALASCHFISGYRIDIDAIGAYLREAKNPVLPRRYSDGGRVSYVAYTRRYGRCRRT
jgi:selenocysteine lyase/cysteine desulfurase